MLLGSATIGRPGSRRWRCATAPRRRPAIARRGVDIVRPTEGIPVRVWVTQCQSGEARVDDEAVTWAGRLVHIRYISAEGREGWAWLCGRRR